MAALQRFRRPAKRNLTPPVLGRARGRFSETGQGRGQGSEAGGRVARQGREGAKVARLGKAVQGRTGRPPPSAAKAYSRPQGGGVRGPVLWGTNAMGGPLAA